MEQIRQNGVAVMSLSNLVDDFCLAQGNMRESNILAQYRHARWSWKELFRKTLWEIRKQVICVDCKTHTFRLPKDCEYLINISVVDCYGIIHPLGFNTNFNTAQIQCTVSKCSCNNCNGQDTLCGAVDSIQATTNTVNIHGTDYTQTILTRYNGNGEMQTQTTTPAWDVATDSVVYNTTVETICNVEVTTKGCIKSTTANMELLISKCGCNFHGGIHSWAGWDQYKNVIPTPYNYWGYYNFNAADSDIVHLFGGTFRTHFGHNEHQEHEWRSNIRQVIVDYQTNGETPETEILVPEFAVEAIQDGMVYRQKRLNPRSREGEKLEAKYAWEASMMKVAKYLNPMNMEDIGKLQTNLRRW